MLARGVSRVEVCIYPTETLKKCSIAKPVYLYVKSYDCESNIMSAKVSF